MQIHMQCSVQNNQSCASGAAHEDLLAVSEADRSVAAVAAAAAADAASACS